MATLIKTNGEVTKDFLLSGLESMQEAVGGFIEMTRSKKNDEEIVICNEEGLLLNLDLNVKAYELTGIPLVGDVIIANEFELE